MRRRLLSAGLVALFAFTSIAMTMPDLVEEDVYYFARRDDCGGDNDHEHLADRPGNDSEGCAFAAGPANEALYATGDPLTYTYAQEDGESFLINHEGSLRGKISTSNWLGVSAASKGYLIADIKVSATRPPFYSETLVEFTEELVLTNGNIEFAFDEEISDALAGVTLSGFSIEVTLRGATTGHTVVNLSGDTYIIIPTLVPAEE